MIAHQAHSTLQYVRDSGGIGSAVVRMIGCADISSARALASLEVELRDDSEVVLNVAAMEFSDTTFLRFLVRLRPFTHGENRRSVTLVGVSAQLQRALEITGLGRYFGYVRHRG